MTTKETMELMQRVMEIQKQMSDMNSGFTYLLGVIEGMKKKDPSGTIEYEAIIKEAKQIWNGQ